MTHGLLKFPIDSEESASFEKLDNLLPKEIYTSLVRIIEESLYKLTRQNTLCGSYRSHHSVLVDGKRGTGKTSILVNLDVYLKENARELSRDTLVLKPIDPTLLEDGDSLFLTIIVASVLSDSNVIESQKQSPENMAMLNRALDKLATSLESAEPDSTAKGMQKIRNMFDNKNLEGCVEEFFSAVLKLVGKKLLVLPIDDVDTSLNRAFENLEIVRRYLTSPCVLPIIGGDLNLYQEVIWRDFHYRLIKDSTFKTEQAFEQAVELANEYQRKVMPVSRRLTMPDVSTYLSNSKIVLTKQNHEYMSLANFYAWLEIFLAGPVNGLENSSLPIPIKSIRALTQLLNRCQDLVPELPKGIIDAKNPMDAKRFWQMPKVPAELINDFYNEFYAQSRDDTEKRRYAKTFIEFANKWKPQAGLELTSDKVRNWEKTIESHFMHEEDAGALNLVLRAFNDWHDIEASHSILDTPLFQPLQQSKPDWVKYEQPTGLDEWQEALEESLPASWLQKLKGAKTILSYPIPQVGVQTNVNWQRGQSYTDKKDTLLTLLTNYNFYSESQQTRMLNSGRIFEILVHSLIAPVSELTLRTIASKAPFYATNDLAPTKTLSLVETNEEGFEDNNESENEDNSQGLSDLAYEIEQWRERHNLSDIRVSPWLVYKVFNKLFTQLSHFQTTLKGSDKAYLRSSLDLLDFTFNATWAAFASFEKGPLFGLPVTVATTNIASNSSANFESNQHFKSNISPFTPRLVPLLKLAKKKLGTALTEPQARHTFGSATKTVTHILADHPIRIWIEEIVKDSSGSKLLEDKGRSKELPERYTTFLKKQYDLTLPPGTNVDKYIQVISTADSIELWTQVLKDTPKQYYKSSNYKALTLAIAKMIEGGK